MKLLSVRLSLYVTIKNSKKKFPQKMWGWYGLSGRATKKELFFGFPYLIRTKVHPYMEVLCDELPTLLLFIALTSTTTSCTLRLQK